MKNFLKIFFLLAAGLAACTENREPEAPAKTESAASLPDIVSPRGVAKMLSSLPIATRHLGEVHGAVDASSYNGYDEEYTLERLFSAPGTGVGDETAGSRSSGGGEDLRDLIAAYLSEHAGSRAEGGMDPESCIQALSDSDMQIYWPYSEDWDGETFPIITFDPGYGAESNYGFLLGFDEAGNRKVDSVIVNETVARTHPVWVVNRNDDSAFTPLELFLRKEGEKGAAGRTLAMDTATRSSSGRNLMIRTFEMKRHYDSWFGGASEFFIKCGAVKGFSAKTEAELKNYSPSVTDMMIVVKRKWVGKPVSFDALLLAGFTNQLDKLAFLVTEDDGGTRTSWKCQATVKINSKSYGFDLEIPFHEKDDIVWRGQLPASFFQSEDEVTGRFGDVVITFALD